MAPKKSDPNGSKTSNEVLADKETVERLLQELSKDSLDGANGGYDDYGYEGFGNESFGGEQYQDYSYNEPSYYDGGSYGQQQFAAAHCMICGARCGSWGDGPVPTGSQGGRRIG